MHGGKRGNRDKDEVKAWRVILILVLLFSIAVFATGFGQHDNGTNKLQLLEKKIHLEVKKK
jgi:hypothetical protein